MSHDFSDIFLHLYVKFRSAIKNICSVLLGFAWRFFLLYSEQNCTFQREAMKRQKKFFCIEEQKNNVSLITAASLRYYNHPETVIPHNSFLAIE